jgi:hypothetical protein
VKNVVILTLFLMTAGARADETVDREPVLDQVMERVTATLKNRRLEPALVSYVSTPGAEAFADRWLHQWTGTVIAEELSAAYAAQTPIELPKSLNPVDLSEFASGEGYDWTALNQRYPDAKAVVRLSTPAFDRLNTIGFVRADVLPSKGRPWTMFLKIERQSNGSWELGLGAHGDYARMRAKGGYKE